MTPAHGPTLGQRYLCRLVSIGWGMQKRRTTGICWLRSACATVVTGMAA
jgi:hypothetical protein